MPRTLGWIIALACVTRYEAWPITGGVLALSAWVWWRLGVPLRRLAPVYARLALYPAAAVAGFLLLSRLTVGEWFVSGGFFVPDPTLQGQPMAVFEQMRDATTSGIS